MKKLLATIALIVLLSSTFATGVYASNNWLNFEGEDKAETTQDNIEEILNILENVHDGKISAEDALKDIRKKEKELKDKIAKSENDLKNAESTKKENEDELKHLRKELETANKVVGKTYEESQKALKKAKEYE